MYFIAVWWKEIYNCGGILAQVYQIPQTQRSSYCLTPARQLVPQPVIKENLRASLWFTNPLQTKAPFLCLLPSFSSPPCHSLWPCPVHSLALRLWSLCHLSITVILTLRSFISSFLSILLPFVPPEVALLWLYCVTLTVGPNCHIIFLSMLSHALVIPKIPTMRVKSWETDAINYSETLCSCIPLDKVLTGEMTCPIV